MGWPEVAMKMMALALEVMTSRMVVLFILCHGDVTSLKKKMLQRLIIHIKKSPKIKQKSREEMPMPGY